MARVFIDGTPVGRTDSSGELSVSGVTPGGHELVAVADGYVDSAAIPFKAAPGAPLDVAVGKLRLVEGRGHRPDLRISRTFDVGTGASTAFLEITNLYTSLGVVWRF